MYLPGIYISSYMYIQNSWEVLHKTKMQMWGQGHVASLYGRLQQKNIWWRFLKLWTSPLFCSISDKIALENESLICGQSCACVHTKCWQLKATFSSTDAHQTPGTPNTHLQRAPAVGAVKGPSPGLCLALWHLPHWGRNTQTPFHLGHSNANA